MPKDPVAYHILSTSPNFQNWAVPQDVETTLEKNVPQRGTELRVWSLLV